MYFLELSSQEAEAGECELVDHGLHLADIYDPNTGPFSLRPPTFGAPPTSGKTKLRAIDFMYLCIEKKAKKSFDDF